MEQWSDGAKTFLCALSMSSNLGTLPYPWEEALRGQSNHMISILLLAFQGQQKYPGALTVPSCQCSHESHQQKFISSKEPF